MTGNCHHILLNSRLRPAEEIEGVGLGGMVFAWLITAGTGVNGFPIIIGYAQNSIV